MSAGAVRCANPAEAATDVQVLGLMVVNAAQVEDALFGSGKVVDSKLPCMDHAHRLPSYPAQLFNHCVLNCAALLSFACPGAPGQTEQGHWGETATL